jgi:peptide/nickel transport system substrate-binding protein
MVSVVKGFGLVLSIVTMLAACASPAAPAESQSGGESRPAAGPKTLTIGLQRGLPQYGGFSGLSIATSASNVTPIMMDGLIYQDYHHVPFPQLATEVPSLEKGTWKIFDDGTMETIWTIRPNIKWHDGTPFTSDDLAFSYTVGRDRNLVNTRNTTAASLQRGVTVVDRQTIVVHWSQPYVDAPITNVGDILPRHILQETYEQQNADTFINHPFFTAEFIGTGPYRVTRWEPGGDMDFVRFDDYYLGRPPFDRVFLKVIGDSNALISNILGGNLDIVLPPGIDLDAALEVKRRWEGTGNVVRADVATRIIQFEVQYRPETAKPRNGFRELAVRKALYQAIDRPALAELMTAGFGPIADSWFPPSSGLRSQVETAIPQYPYNPAAATALLESAGWRMGGAGVLVHHQTGESFSPEIWANVPAGWAKLATVVANGWKPLGVQAEITPIPPAMAGNREFEVNYPGLFVTNVNFEQFSVNRLDSRVKTGPENRYTAANRGGYENPRVDELYDRLTRAILPDERVQVQRQLLEEVMGQVAFMPLYWETNPVLKLKGVKDHEGRGSWTWFFFDYDKTE